ncbi:hypothetical protein DKZ35_11565, partial [Limosilactobacillus reuteri]
MRIHKLEIINSSKYQNYTNGPVEGTNNKIKVIKRTAYGFRNFFNYRPLTPPYVRFRIRRF